MTLWFESTNELSSYKPGQYLSLSALVDNDLESRSYSINTSPFQDDDVAVTFRVIPGGKFSKYLTENAREGLMVALDGPFGDFTLVPSHGAKKHYAFFAGGSGITPIVSMIRSVLYNEPDSIISLVYANRRFNKIIFREEIEILTKVFEERFFVYHAISETDDIPTDFNTFYKGRLSKLITKKLVKDLMSKSESQIEYYMCGPFGFMEMITESLVSLNVGAEYIHKEYFYVPHSSNVVDFNSLPTTEVIIRWKDQDRLVEVAPGESILQSALSSGINLPHSCKAGQCGMCRSLLISGEVEMRKNHILTPDEMKDGQVLLCEGFPTSNNVVVIPSPMNLIKVKN